MARTIIVIGGAHGGLVAAARARQFNEQARIILVEKSPHVTWVQADLRYYFEGNLTLLEKSLFENERYFGKYFNVEVRVNTKAIALDMDSKFVLLESKDEIERVGFDAVIFATGSFSKNVEVEGLEGANICHFRNLEDVLKIKAAISQGAKKAVVLGCGFYGVEVAQGLKAAGLSVEIVEKSHRILPRFSLTAAQAIVHQLQKQGIVVHLADFVVKAKAKRQLGFDLQLASGKILDADIVIIAVGSSPQTQILENAGAALQKDGSVRVDEHMLTTLPSVYACGSAVCVLQAITHERVWIPGPSVVERTAQIAGYNAALGTEDNLEVLKPVTNTQMIHVNHFWFARTGLNLSEARKHFGETAVFTSTVHSRVSEAWVDGEDITVGLIIDRTSQTIVGGEVWGKRGVSRRIDMISVAVLEKWSPDKLVDLDMAYAPLLGPAFDPLKEAGTLASLALSEKTKSISGENLALWIAQQRAFTLIDVSKKQDKIFKWPNGVRHLPLENLREQVHTIEMDKPVVISSRTGRRAFLAHRILLQLGFSEVYHLDGGELSWSLMTGNAARIPL